MAITDEESRLVRRIAQDDLDGLLWQIVFELKEKCEKELPEEDFVTTAHYGEGLYSLLNGEPSVLRIVEFEQRGDQIQATLLQKQRNRHLASLEEVKTKNAKERENSNFKAIVAGTSEKSVRCEHCLPSTLGSAADESQGSASIESRDRYPGISKESNS